MRKDLAMKKRNIIISALFVILFGLGCPQSKAQGIFIMDDEEENLREPNSGGGWSITIDDPFHNTTLDYSPIGNGVWLLGALGGAYLLGKRRKKEK